MSTIRLPFSFDDWFVTATFVGNRTRTRERLGRSGNAWRLLRRGAPVLLEVRTSTPGPSRTLRFRNGDYLGFSDGNTEFPGRDCPEREMFVAACSRRLAGHNENGEPWVRPSGALRRVLKQLVSEAA